MTFFDWGKSFSLISHVISLISHVLKKEYEKLFGDSIDEVVSFPVFINVFHFIN